MQKIIHGDCLEVLRRATPNSIDAIITDPPYELGFMGKSWDSTGIANNVELWKECLRVLKPGGHLLAFSGTRTYHRMASAIEDAGFEVRDMIEWVYGSGFPKSLNIGKSVEAFVTTGNASKNGFHKLDGERRDGRIGMYDTVEEQGFRVKNPDQLGAYDLDPTTDEAKQWNGYGTALKPAHEPICMARKPLEQKTVAENCLKWGTGGINIDESRVGTGGDYTVHNAGVSGSESYQWNKGEQKESSKEYTTTLGRFPANLIHDGSDEVKECFPETKSTGGRKNTQRGQIFVHGGECEAHTDSGNASRFFKSIIYQAKASKSERNEGCEELDEKQSVGGGGGVGDYLDDVNSASGKFGSEKAPAKNNHPTVKPVALMEYLIKMVTREGQIVLDPFAGSGTTLLACKNLGRGYVGIEREEEYIKIINARLGNTL